MSLEKQLQASASVSEELRATIEVNRKQLEDVRNQKVCKIWNPLLSRHSNFLGPLVERDYQTQGGACQYSFMFSLPDSLTSLVENYSR